LIKKNISFFLVAGLVVAIMLFSLSNYIFKKILNSSVIATNITQYVDKNYAEGGVDVKLTDFTEFDWDRALVFNYPTSAKEISDVLHVNYDKSLDLISGIIFVKSDKITYDEIFKNDYESPPRFFIYPHRDINAQPKYKVFTRDNAVFECERKEYKYHNCYVLIPRVNTESTVEVKFYYLSQENPYFGIEDLKFKTENISVANMSADTIKFMKKDSDVQINKIWYEGNRLCVDLNENERAKLDAGSTAGEIITNILLKTFSSYPNVKEIEILIDGERGSYGNHFNFEEVFKVNGGE